jgi:hypothetical protein
MARPNQINPMRVLHDRVVRSVVQGALGREIVLHGTIDENSSDAVGEVDLSGVITIYARFDLDSFEDGTFA